MVKYADMSDTDRDVESQMASVRRYMSMYRQMLHEQCNEPDQVKRPENYGKPKGYGKPTDPEYFNKYYQEHLAEQVPCEICGTCITKQHMLRHHKSKRCMAAAAAALARTSATSTATSSTAIAADSPTDTR